MAHVETKDVGPLLDQLPQDFGISRSRSQRANDFRLAHRSGHDSGWFRKSKLVCPVGRARGAVEGRPFWPPNDELAAKVASRQLQLDHQIFSPKKKRRALSDAPLQSKQADVYFSLP
jgi:hypothetical protein